MKKHTIKISEFIHHSKERTYYKLPFQMPEDVERLEISYSYKRFEKREAEGFAYSTEINIIDLALESFEGEHVGSSGSNKHSIYISEYESTKGYAKSRLFPGTWNIIVGAYKVHETGVTVEYTIDFIMKHRRLLKGDNHMHTLGSDGKLTVREITELAKTLELDYIFITDHNNFTQNFLDADIPGITVMPGTEWTHFNGHVGMLGVKQPYKSPFGVNTLEQACEKIIEAKNNGAFIVPTHPFCRDNGWNKWSFEALDYDGIEIWNGDIIPADTMKCISWWHSKLVEGRKIPVIGGSDFHRAKALRMLGSPTTCVYALSPSPHDILSALRSGNCFMTLDPNSACISVESDGKILGETAKIGSDIQIELWNLSGGEKLHLITDKGREIIDVPTRSNRLKLVRKSDGIKFYRFELYQTLAEGLKEMLTLISNPIYFE